ncbi:hypothetical protein S40285_04296 [Stachybotrys chlorohalonatus IBT 40285]|uniref:Alpha box domain-containing protein n=1 Tax=Stachybotrys chlorohalonatus (strain IBT 40285) TaxID=1283841 RepID=A0A084QQ65_STAC4|nr:hypothetical protein S40285_04296 [Stachybotrys chlorohalonata IBT 40285]
MDARASITQALSGLSPGDILRFLSDETLAQLMRNFQDMAEQYPPGDAMDSAAAPALDLVQRSDKAKRPLNGFMAFRSCYLKLFPDLQQKIVSGFLTTLWNKDPVRNKWALIAKVYSFVRDEATKEKISLSRYLDVCCPQMKIVEPSQYLAALGWSIQVDHTGTQTLVQNEANITISETNINNGNFPDTELSLLSSLVVNGFLPKEGPELVAKLSTNNNGMMATTQGEHYGAVPPTRSKIKFLELVVSNNEEAARQLLGSDFDQSSFAAVGARTYYVPNVADLSDASMQPQYPNPELYYDYSSMQVDLFQEVQSVNYHNIPDGETYDIDNPFDLDLIAGIVPQAVDPADEQVVELEEYDPSMGFNIYW